MSVPPAAHTAGNGMLKIARATTAVIVPSSIEWHVSWLDHAIVCIGGQDSCLAGYDQTP
jgi:hypothetical protein